MARIPKSRVAFWTEKLTLNRTRDSFNVTKLIGAGWEVLVLWECELKAPDLLPRLATFLERSPIEDIECCRRSDGTIG